MPDPVFLDISLFSNLHELEDIWTFENIPEDKSVMQPEWERCSKTELVVSIESILI